MARADHNFCHPIGWRGDRGAGAAGARSRNRREAEGMSAVGVFNPSRLTWARRRRGMTKTRLAAAVGVDLRSVSAYETGEFSPDRDRLDQVARALKFPQGFFFGYDLEQPALYTARFRSLSKKTAGQSDTALGSSPGALLLHAWIEASFSLAAPDTPH